MAAVPMPQGLSLALEPFYVWENLFRDMDMTQQLVISIDDNATTRSLILSKSQQLSLAAFSLSNKDNPLLQPINGTYALNFTHAHDGESEETGRFLLTHTGFALNFDAPPRSLAPPFGIYFGPNIVMPQQAVAEWIGKLEQDNKKEQLVDNIRHLLTEVEDIFIVPRHGAMHIFTRLQNGQSMPIRAMGDGINKLLQYLSVIVANPGGIFLFDEIETGFHYSFYPKLWKLVSFIAKSTNSQIIATTHSYECISAAVEGASEIDSSLLTYVRLGKEDDVIIPYSFTGDDLVYALKREMEIR
jgi:hypothetical protein